MSAWQEASVGDLAEIYDGPHATPTKTADGPWFLSISSLNNGRLDLAESAHLSQEDFLQWTRRVTPMTGDVLFSYETRLGDAALMPPDVEACLGRRMGLLRVRPGMADPRFLLYTYLGPDFQATIQERKVPGATVDRIPLVEMGKGPTRVPPLAEQQAIAAVLGALDDKIAVNERIAATTEALAIALASEARWDKRVILGQLCELRKEQVSPQDLLNSTVAHYSLPAYDTGKMAELVSPDVIKSNKFLVQAPSVLLSKLNPEIPRVWEVEPQADIPAVASTEFLVLSPRSGFFTHEIWAVASQAGFLARLAAKVTGTSKSHQRVRPADVLSAEVVDPRAFGQVRQQISSLSMRSSLARQESVTLASLRDTLLPKLMSGQLTVKQAETLAEDVA